MLKIFSYLFSPTQPSTFNYATYLLIFSLVLIIGGIIFKAVEMFFYKNLNNKAFKRTFRSFPSQLIWCGILLLILVESRINNIAYLSMRILLVIVIGLSFYFIGKTIYKAFTVYPKMKKITGLKKTKKEKKKYTTSKNH